MIDSSTEWLNSRTVIVTLRHIDLRHIDLRHIDLRYVCNGTRRVKCVRTHVTVRVKHFSNVSCPEEASCWQCVDRSWQVSESTYFHVIGNGNTVTALKVLYIYIYTILFVLPCYRCFESQLGFERLCYRCVIVEMMCFCNEIAFFEARKKFEPMLWEAAQAAEQCWHVS